MSKVFTEPYSFTSPKVFDASLNPQTTPTSSAVFQFSEPVPVKETFTARPSSGTENQSESCE